jgi:hypothetical protein
MTTQHTSGQQHGTGYGHWRKSSRSSPDNGNGNCVEARTSPGGFEVRDSKLGEDSPIFGMSPSDFVALARGSGQG